MAEGFRIEGLNYRKRMAQGGKRGFILFLMAKLESKTEGSMMMEKLPNI